MPKVSQILVAIFLIIPSFSNVLILYGLASNPNPIWFIIAILLSIFFIVFTKRKRKFHIVDQLIFSLIIFDFIFCCSGIILGGDAKIRILGLYREVGIYIPYLFARSVYMFKGEKFFYPILGIVLGTYLIGAIIGILQQFGIFTFEAVARQAYRNIIPNIDLYSGTSFLNRESGIFSAIRSYGWIGSPLDYGQLMATSASICWVLFLSAKKLNLKALFFSSFFILAAGVVSSITRNYYLCLFLSTLFVTLYNSCLNLKYAKYIQQSPNKKYFILTIISAIATLFLVTLLVLASPGSNSKNNTFILSIEKTFSSTLSNTDTSTNEHLEDILLFPELLSKEPMGGGLGSFGVASSRFGDGKQHLEGVWYAQILQRGIIIQSIIFSILFSIVFSIIKRGQKLFKDGLYRKVDTGLYRFIILSNIAIFINTFVSGFFLPDLYNLSNACLVFAIIAFSSSVVFTPK
jgi:hypothetical protein